MRRSRQVEAPLERLATAASVSGRALRSSGSSTGSRRSPRTRGQPDP
jgi:hypothetical protein